MWESWAFWEGDKYEYCTNQGKFGHAQGVLKEETDHIAEFEIRVVLEWENPAHGGVPRSSRTSWSDSVHVERSDFNCC